MQGTAISYGRSGGGLQQNRSAQSGDPPEELQQVFASMGLTEASFRQEMAENLKIEILLAEKVPSIPEVTDGEVNDFYEKNPNMRPGIRNRDLWATEAIQESQSGSGYHEPHKTWLPEEEKGRKLRKKYKKYHK